MLPVNTNTLPARLDANVRMTSTATLAININNPASYGFLHATSLRPAGKLEVYLRWQPAQVRPLTLVQRDFPLNDPRYVFDGLPDGGTFDSPDNGRGYRISYAGGATGNDIVLTDIGSTVAPSAPSRLRLASLPGALGATLTLHSAMVTRQSSTIESLVSRKSGANGGRFAGDVDQPEQWHQVQLYGRCTKPRRIQCRIHAGAETIAPPSAPQKSARTTGPGFVSLPGSPVR